MDNSAWQNQPQHWLKQRETEWKIVARNLKRLKIHFRGDYIPYHKTLFFKGEVPAAIENVGGDDVFAWALPLFICWYHPQPSEQVFNAIFESQLDPTSRARSRTLLFEFEHRECVTQYGLMNGREQWLVKVLLPCYDHNKVRQYMVRGRQWDFELSLAPNLISKHCLNGAIPLLRGKPRNPFHPGQYLWDHLSANWHEVNNELDIERLNQACRLVLEYDKDDDSAASQLAKRLRLRYEQRDFSKSMLKVWDKVAKQIK